MGQGDLRAGHLRTFVEVTLGKGVIMDCRHNSAAKTSVGCSSIELILTE